ncbi:NAD-dependent epimerase [Acrocarpospora corrugata]|uniref:NAD-dependent epimerase n=1 Tax=Acrocarpospora corrugata TaxID=35763 RepID=A0A5M3VTC6_9ACTN|nr:NAD-dependent epimerase/dehydratase family protein [Acrocarpospora corrugata]GER97990.1 NAD-dependent epimerase [Acrocarpospora corrugata]
MLVCVTGGTGFVGSHSVAALIRAGHRVRLLVRDPAGVEHDAVDAVAGDMTDEAAVARAVRGADAVLHAAAVYSFDSRRHAEMRRVNTRGAEVVLGAARRAGVGRIVHVSTVGALYPAPPGVIGPTSPVGRPRETYLASKAGAEEVARGHQLDGVPVVITYPPALAGPDDPRLGDQNARIRDVLRGLMPMWPTGGFPLGDVRDTAELHLRALTGPDVGGRHFGPGRYVATREFLGALRQVTGRPLRAAYLPARAMLPAARLADLAQRWWPWHIPAQYGAVYTCAVATPVDEGASTLAVPARPLAETMGDTVSWLRATGRITARQAGAAERVAVR